MTMEEVQSLKELNEMRKNEEKVRREREEKEKEAERFKGLFAEMARSMGLDERLREEGKEKGNLRKDGGDERGSETVVVMKELVEAFRDVTVRLERLEGELLERKEEEVFKKPRSVKRTASERDREEKGEGKVREDEDDEEEEEVRSVGRRRLPRNAVKGGVRAGRSPSPTQRKRSAKSAITRIRGARSEKEKRKVVDEVFAREGWRTLFEDIVGELEAGLDAEVDKEEAVAGLLRWFRKKD